jgi:hypothetical protein
MKISELIKELQDTLDIYGDIETEIVYDSGCARASISGVEINGDENGNPIANIHTEY